MEWLIQTLQFRRYELLIPSDDIVMQIVIEHREKIEALTTCLLPPNKSYEQAADKYTTTLLAMKAGIPCPQTLCPKDMEEVKCLAEKLSYPVVIKPRKSSGSRGIRIVKHREELVSLYQQIAMQYTRPMIQEFIPLGERYDVCLLYNRNGELRGSFVQKEVRHFPVDIGPSTVQKSVWMPELVEQAKTLMQNLPWCGVVEIEFMQDPRDGIPKLMEINPRYWNSLEMAIQSGVDFPYMMYQAAIKGDAKEVHHYTIGKFCCNLLPGEILHFLSAGNRRSMNPPFFSFGNPSLRDDILSWDDPMPVFGFMTGAFRLLFDRKIWNMMFKR
ncbi:carboxylate--amine ligase [Aneurinibacillus soli]|uniref:carboxylate--amine ligase n=1 Tax=Aneurinibacillus soli TaxID=1500254 RepID=UPI001E4C3B5A|nr:ATP-grasp domain-containing protein [Aneurinibacillus soli]